MFWIEIEEDQLDCNLSTLESANYLNKELLKQIDALKDENHSVSLYTVYMLVWTDIVYII